MNQAGFVAHRLVFDRLPGRLDPGGGCFARGNAWV